MQRETTDVLVVGAGPAGLITSALLSRAGISSLTVTKYGSTADSPRAHVVNQRSNEVFRDLGIDQRVMANAMPQALGFRGDQTYDEAMAILDHLHGPDGESRRQALQAAMDLLNGQFNAHGVEMGQRYESAAVVNDGTPYPTDDRDPDLYYVPTTHPGAHVPHVWLERDTAPVSTLDLCAYDRFTLITGIDGHRVERRGGERRGGAERADRRGPRRSRTARQRRARSMDPLPRDHRRADACWCAPIDSSHGAARARSTNPTSTLRRVMAQILDRPM